MKLTIGFSRAKGFAPISKLIMACERTNFSHAYIRIRSESLDRDLLYQAAGSGVHFVGRALFEQTAQVVEEYEIQIPDENRKAFLQWCVDEAGKPYGRLQILGLALIRLLKLFGIKIKNPFPNGDGAYVCCELVYRALRHLDIVRPQDQDAVDLNAIKEMVLQVS